MTDDPATFTGVLFLHEGPEASGRWTFVEVPPELAPDVVGAWGRTPVTATVDGTTWETSVWTERGGRVLLAVPRRVRGGKEAGAEVVVTFRPR